MGSYARAGMSFRDVRYGPYTITLMDGNEPGYCDGQPLLVSIEGPGLPTLRLREQGPEPLRDDDGKARDEGERGVVVFGRWKGDRPRLGRREDGADGDED